MRLYRLLSAGIAAAAIILSATIAVAQETPAPGGLQKKPESETSPAPSGTPTGADGKEQLEPNAKPREGINIPSLPDVNVTAARAERQSADLPYSADTVKIDTGASAPQRTLQDEIGSLPGVSGQKTSHGQGSPYIRGFTGFNTLLLIDGIRLNNSVFRSGPNQYWGTVDSYSLDRMELVRGPSSVLYGSDAVGGTVNAITIDPVIAPDRDTGDARIFYRYAGAERSHIGRAEFRGSMEGKFGVVLGATGKEFGDLVGGKRIGVQPATGYLEYDFDAKAVYRLSSELTVKALVQHVFVDDAWRTHATSSGISWAGTAVGTDRERSYDQQRDLGYLQAQWKPANSFLRRVSASVSYQYQQEDYLRIRSNGAREVNGFDVGTLGEWLTAEADTPVGRITAGFESWYDTVNTWGSKYNADGTLNSTLIQGQVGDDSTYELFGVFAQDEIDLCKSLQLTAGLRLTYAAAHAGEVEDPDTGDLISIDDSWANLSGSLRAILKPSDDFRIFAGMSQGFRAPNLSDLSRLDTARSDEIETPSPDLEPETFLTLEIGARSIMKRFEAQVSVYYTFIFDGIVRYPTGAVIDGDYEVRKANVGDGFLYGLEASALARLGAGFSVRGSFSYVEGMQKNYDANRDLTTEWVSKLAPMKGTLALRFADDKGRVWAELEAVAAGKADKLSLSDQGDTQRIPQGGTPGYELLNFRVGAKASEHVSFFGAAENLLDRDYRVHGSGVNGPGVNLVLGVEIK